MGNSAGKFHWASFISFARTLNCGSENRQLLLANQFRQQFALADQGFVIAAKLNELFVGKGHSAVTSLCARFC